MQPNREEEGDATSTQSEMNDSVEEYVDMPLCYIITIIITIFLLLLLKHQQL